MRSLPIVAAALGLLAPPAHSQVPLRLPPATPVQRIQPDTNRPAPSCALQRRVYNMPDRPIRAFMGDSGLVGLMDTLVVLWTPPSEVIDIVFSPWDSILPHRRRAVDSLWARDSVRLLEALTMIILDRRGYGNYAAGQASEEYERLWGRELPLLQYSIWAGDFFRVFLLLTALQPPLSPAAQDVVLGLACEPAWLVQVAERDSILVSSLDLVNTTTPAWLKDAALVIYAARPLLTGAHLATLESVERSAARP